MPIYTYRCNKCNHFFEKIELTGFKGTSMCPECGGESSIVPSVPAPAVINHKPSLPYGNGSMGKYVSSKETGGLPVYVPSFGAMEREEVDYVAGMAVEKERERVAKNRPLSNKNAETKEAMRNLVTTTKAQPAGERAKTFDKINKEGLR